MKVKDLKKDMYIRNDYGIDKIKDLCDCSQCQERGFIEPYTQKGEYLTEYVKDLEIKASFNIIDLIEVNDLVNGSIVTNISITNKLFENNGDFINLENDGVILENVQIKTILTHEQIKTNEYKVEG